jgi:cation diffusion facilitator family transporter
LNNLPFLKTQQQNLNIQRWIAAISVLILAAKFLAYWLTHSVAILTDAMESIVNVAAGFIGLYSLYISAKPRDINHPYGHGKAEFLSAAVEGTLILSAGAIIIYKAIQHFIYPSPITSIDKGMILVGMTGLINLCVGFLGFRYGKRNQSLALIASGRHLISDSYSTFGIVAGLLLISITKLVWIDGAIAVAFGVIIIYAGYRIVRSSIAGIMDEADEELLEKMVRVFNASRKENWVDIHNLRVIKYGIILHVDCHLTVPWYLNVNEAHAEVEALGSFIKREFGESIELFVHSDGCLYVQCPICLKSDCPVRHHPFEKKIEWSLGNILSDKKHQL